MATKIKEFLIALLPCILVVLLGVAGTELYKAGEGVRGSSFVNQPGNISLFDEGGQLEMAQRVLNGQVPYRDFWTLYTPLRLYFLAGSMKILGESILTERLYFAFVPVLGFIFFYLLIRLLTKNSFLAFLATVLVIAGHTVSERNTLFIITLFLFARSIRMRQEENAPGKNCFSYLFAFLTGLSSALTFLMSQEFGLYSFAGIIIFLSLFSLLNRIPIGKFFRFLFFCCLGMFLVLAPFFFYLLFNNALPYFVQNTFLDFVSGPVARLWAEPLPNFVLPDFSGLFRENSLVYSLSFLSYLSVFFFLLQIIFSLWFLLARKTDESTHDLTVGVSSFVAQRQGSIHPLANASGIVRQNKTVWWAMFFLALFGLLNSRGLFFTLKDSRFSDVFTFVLAGIILVDAKIISLLGQNKYRLSGVFLALFLIIINWYAVSLVPLREFINDFSQMLTFSYRPNGVYFDNPRAKIYLVNPYYQQTIRDANLSIAQNTAGLLQYTGFFPGANWQKQAKGIDRELKQTFNRMKNTTPKMSEIESNDKNLQNKFVLWKNNLATVSAELEILRAGVKKQEKQTMETENKILKQNSANDNLWLLCQKQLIQLRSIYVYIDKLSETVSKLAFYLPEKPSQSVYQQQFSYLFEIPDFLEQSKEKYAFGIPAASLYLFLADKINPTRFTAVQTNITLKDQQIAVQALEKTKPCRAVRQKVGVQYLDVSQYAPLLWQYLETNYRVVKTVGNAQLMLRKSCKF